MININYNTTQDVTFYLKPSLPTPVYLFSLVSHTTRERINFIASELSNGSAFLRFSIAEVGTGAANLLTGDIKIKNYGRYTLELYEQVSTVNLDHDLATFLGDDELIARNPVSYDSPPSRNNLDNIITLCPLSASVFITNETSFEAGDGTARADLLNNVGNITYSWDTEPVQTTRTATGLNEGTYTVTVTDDNEINCNAIGTGTVEISDPLPECLFTIDGFNTVNTTDLASDGSATVLVSGGSGNYHYVWKNGETGNTLLNLPTGVVSVSVSDLDVDASCIKADFAIILSLNIRYLFLDGFNDHLLFSSLITVAGNWTLQMEFKVNTFEQSNTLTSASNSDIILTRSSTIIDVALANSVRPFTVPLMSTNTFHHLLIVDDGTNIRLYLNGVESTTGGLSSATLKVSKIGELASGALSMGSGVDNFGIDPNAADSAKRIALRKKPSTFYDELPTATVFLKLNESGADTLAVDETANGNDATATDYAAGAIIWADR